MYKTNSLMFGTGSEIVTIQVYKDVAYGILQTQTVIFFFSILEGVLASANLITNEHV